MLDIDEITGILIVLRVGPDQALFLLLGSDGSITRRGNASTENLDTNMFMGRIDPGAFANLVERASSLETWLGNVVTYPDIRGQECELTIAFRTKPGEEQVANFRYGVGSEQPPQPVRDYVIAALDATDAWYAEQRRTAGLA